MKKLTVLLATLFIFLSGDAQQILSGIYSGSMYNDSTRMLQRYELALSEYKGKVMGYSYVTFVVNDTFYYGIRRVKGYKNNNNELVLTDEELLANNFPESPAKKVKRTATFALAQEDTITHLTGSWQTNRTRQYYSVGGATKTERSVDSSQSALVAHLKELKIISGAPDYQDDAVAKRKPKKEEKKAKETDVARRSEPKNRQSEPVASQSGANTKTGAPADTKGTTAAAGTTPGADKNTIASADVTKATTGQPDNKTISANAGSQTPQGNGNTDKAVAANTGAVTSKPASPQATEDKKAVTSDSAVAKTATQKKDADTAIPGTETARNTNPANTTANTDNYTIDPKTGDIITRKPANTVSGNTTDIARTTDKKAAESKPEGQKDVAAKPVAADSKPADAGIKQTEQDKVTADKAVPQKSDAVAGSETKANANAPAAAAASSPDNRTSRVIRTLEVMNDSITLSFYDNGVVDGDVISVYVNGENVLASKKLTEVAMKKTIHLANFAADTIEVTLVAETLGSIPPNTGLLLVHDGDMRYDVRFSADMQTNASIMFRKAKK